MKRSSIIILACLLASALTANAAILVSETFDTPGTIADYTGTGELFTAYTQTGTGAGVVADGALTMSLTSGEVGTLYAHIGLADGEANALDLMSMQFDFRGNGYGAAGNAWQFFTGSFNSIGDFDPGWNIHSGARNWSYARVAGGSPYTVGAYDGTNTAYTQAGQVIDTWYTWTIYLNQSGSTQTFTGPDGATHSLDTDRWSFFLGDTLLADNVVKGTEGDSDYITGAIFSLARNYDGGYTNSSIDNVVIRDDLDVAIPEPATLGLLGTMGVALLARRRMRR